MTEPVTTPLATSAFEPDTSNSAVRKWRKQILGVSDFNDPEITIPTKAGDLFYLDPATAPAGRLYTPKPLVPGIHDMGYITPDGVTHNREVASDDTSMLQSLESVRSDVTSIDKTVAAVLGEANAWTRAMAHGLPVSMWPADKHGANFFADGRIVDNPFYVFWQLAQDGVGPSAIYRIELLLKVKVSAQEGRKMNAADPETYGYTWKSFKDDVLGFSHLSLDEGPGKSSHLAPDALPFTV